MMFSKRRIPTSTVVDEMGRAETQRQIESILSRPELKMKLANLGLPQAEITKRLAALSDAELVQLKSQLDMAHYGGDDVAGILIVVVLVLLIIFLIKRL